MGSDFCRIPTMSISAAQLCLCQTVPVSISAKAESCTGSAKATSSIGGAFRRARAGAYRRASALILSVLRLAGEPIIFLFTGRGTRHGYVDEWSADGRQAN